MAGQSKSGKAFEYALLSQCVIFFKKAYAKETNIINNSAYKIAKQNYDAFNTSDKKKYDLAAVAAIESINSAIEKDLKAADSLNIKLMDDSEGIDGDVRDVVIYSTDNSFEIGFSAKNNHNALKHSRLSQTIDIGKEWIGIPSDKSYFDFIKPIFEDLTKKREEGKEWKQLANKSESVYKPLLMAFKTEIERLVTKHPDMNIPTRLAEYLIGRKDFFKIIKIDKKSITKVMAFNFRNNFGTIKKISLPTEITSFEMKKNSKTTLIMKFNGEWEISFRIHSASTKVEPSLKFDVSLISYPDDLIAHSCAWVK